MDTLRLPIASIRHEKAFNIIMNARLCRTPQRKLVLVDLRSDSEYAHEQISDFQHIPNVADATALAASLAAESAKFTIIAIPGQEDISDFLRSRLDVFSTFISIDFHSFTAKFPILLTRASSSEDTRRLASAAFPTFAAEDVLFASLFSFNEPAIVALKIRRIVDMTPNGLSCSSVPMLHCSEVPTAAAAVADALRANDRVLVVDARDGNAAALAATAGIAIFSGVDATTAATRVMAKTDVAFSPSAEDVQTIAAILMAQKSKTSPTIQKPGLTPETLSFPLQSIPGVYTRVVLPALREGRKFAAGSIDALQEKIVAEQDRLSLDDREHAIEQLATTILNGAIAEDRDGLRQACCLLAFISDEWPEEVELTPEVTRKISEISEFSFSQAPTEYYGTVQYSAKDGFPESLTDCVRALVIALQLVL